MKRIGVNYIVSIVLLLLLIVTGLTGYIQAQLELRKFIPHRYLAYTTLVFAGVHVYFNIVKLFRYIRQKVFKNHSAG